MKKYKKRIYIDPMNKIWKYITFDKRDKVICDFIDYLAFYWERSSSQLQIFLWSDNGPALYVWRIAIERATWFNVFTAYWTISVAWIPVKIMRLQEIQIKHNMYLKVDIYWKGVKLIREEGLWNDVYKLLKNYCGMSEVILTRADYTVDCAKYNFRKKNSLSACTWWTIYKRDRKVKDKDLDVLNTAISQRKDDKKQIQYILFGSKSSSNARFIRYYDKKAEIIARWTQFLYPEYFEYPEVMRYELQVNSKGFDEYERVFQIEDIQKFINFGLNVLDNKNTHKRLQRNESMYQRIKYWISYLKRHDDIGSLEKVKLLLFTPEELKKIWDIDWAV